MMKGKVLIDASNPIVRATATSERGPAKKVRDSLGRASARCSHRARLQRDRLCEAAEFSQRQGERIGMPIAGDDQKAIEIASGLIREVGLEPVLVGPLAMGKYLIPGTPLGGEHTPDQIRQIVATLK